ncbi:MAG: NfeD family protein [Chitinophagales bacterium]|nr:NfeD family protein [Chitinophagales bacterium]
MSVIAILLLMLSGTVLVFLELFFLPGIITGLIGIGLYSWGVYEAFTSLGTNWGWIFLIVSIIVNFIVFFYAFKNLYRSRLANKENIDGRVNKLIKFDLQVGDKGQSLTDLRPEGRGVFKDEIVTVWSRGNRYISANEPLIITQIEHNKIFVTNL